MITVDTCGITAYSPLIPAIKAMCTATPGETIEIIMNHADAFQDLKEYLSEQGIGGEIAVPCTRNPLQRG